LRQLPSLLVQRHLSLRDSQRQPSNMHILGYKLPQVVYKRQ
jgi:hypothetical protein